QKQRVIPLRKVDNTIDEPFVQLSCVNADANALRSQHITDNRYSISIFCAPPPDFRTPRLVTRNKRREIVFTVRLRRRTNQGFNRFDRGLLNSRWDAAKDRKHSSSRN